MSKKRRNDRLNPLYRPLVLATLMAGGILQPLMPVLAAGVAAGTGISNTATATYKDDSNNSFNATSNTVTVTVAEIAGLLAASSGVTDVDGGAVEAGDTLEYLFTVTNVGNTATNIHIPTPVGQNFTPTNVLVSTDGGNIYAALSTFPGGIVTGVPADGSILVKVVGTIPTTGLSAGDDIKVTLGNTGPNDNSAATQNQPDAADNAQATEIRTENAIGDPPANGEREASASQFVDFATSIKPLALATLKKTATITPGTSQTGNDDIITYGLNLIVEDTSPSGAFSPAALEGTAITLNNATANRILMSDVIPTGTTLSVAPTAPAGWTVVYSTDDPALTTPVQSTLPGALAAAKWSDAPLTTAVLPTVKRIGFVKNAGTMAPGDTISASFKVVTSGLPGTGGTVYNVAQVFGQTENDPTNEVIYDESGDNNPNNFNDNQTPPDATGSNFDPSSDTGVPNPTQDGTDPGNNNTGTGPNGEDNVVTITGTVPEGEDDIFNGPKGAPDAVGPTDANDDFTNAAVSPPQGQSSTVPFDPAAVTFSNTLSNPSIVTLSNVTIEPISPSEAAAASGLPISAYGADTDIPLGTKVTINYPDPDGAGPLTAQTATYNYTATGFTIYAGSTPVNVGAVAPGAVVNYTVTVDMPQTAGTIPFANIPIPIIAFPDDDTIGSPGYNGADGNAATTPELTNNVSIDRVYLGYMKLLKEARILNAAGGVVEGWTDTITQKVEPGQFIEYRIRYENISSQANGAGNVVLNANDFQIVEDGAAVLPGATPDNNWGANTLHQQNTSASNGSVTFYLDSTTVIGTTDPADNATVGKYVNEVGSVAPGVQGSFQFRREVK